jgi:RNase adaptor protein for sRNA GlmZ degradation
VSPVISEEANVQAAFSYSTSEVSLNSLTSDSTSMLGEKTSDQRFMRFMNPVFKYDFKVGNYMPDDVKKMNPHLFNTIKDVTTGIRKSS